MAKHTPGPWSVEDPMDFELVIVEAGKQAYEWKFIATLQHGKNEFPRTVVEANAHLIAAAPELLEALTNLVRFVETTENAFCEVAQDAIAAIAKATGSATAHGDHHGN